MAAGGDDAEILLTELLGENNWPLSEDYVYISSMAATERLVAAIAAAGGDYNIQEEDDDDDHIAVWRSKLRFHGLVRSRQALVAVRDGAWIRISVREDEIEWILEGPAAEFPITRSDLLLVLNRVLNPERGRKALKEVRIMPLPVLVTRATPLLLQTFLLQTQIWTPRLRLAFSIVDYLVLRQQTPHSPPLITQLLERTVIAGEIALDLIATSGIRGIELYWPDDRKFGRLLPTSGAAAIPFFAGMHWSLVFYSVDQSVAWIYDSLGQQSSHAILACQWLRSMGARLPEIIDRLPTLPAWSTAQQSGCECGWYSIIAAASPALMSSATAQVSARYALVHRRWRQGDEAVAQDLDKLYRFLTI
jgi:hypothetical protein